MSHAHITSTVVAAMQQQLGLIRRGQLIELDVPVGRIEWWLEHGVIEAVHRAIYRRSAAFVPASQPLLAAVMTCGDGAVAGSRPSLRLSGLDWLESRGIQATIPTPRHLRPKPFKVVARTLSSADRRMIGAIPGMTGARAVIDLAPELGEPVMRSLIDDLRRRGLLAIPALGTRATELEHLHGSRMVLRAIGAGRFDQESDGERMLQGLLAGMHPQPRWQVADLVPGRRLDACWVEALYALEFDGREHHVLPTDRDHDGMRDLETTVGHVLVHRITAGMIRERPTATRNGIRDTYERRLAEVLALSEAGIIPPDLAHRARLAA